MAAMIPERINVLIEHPREIRTAEYKLTLDWSLPEAKAKIVKCMLAFANTSDGGAIILGVRENGNSYFSEGMELAHYQKFNQDDVATEVARYAEPYLEFDLYSIERESRCFVAIDVHPFREIPVVCKKEGLNNLRAGALYVRGRRMNECADVANDAEMREVLDRAIDLGVQKFLKRAHSAGLGSKPATRPAPDLFEKELRDSGL